MLTLHWTTATLLFCLAVAAVTLVSCAISWKRSGYSRATGMLEALRILLVAMAVFTLLQPEMPQAVQPEHQPTLVVLHDVSDSMKTQDVVPANANGGEIQTRADATVTATDPNTWAAIGQRMKVVVQPFSSSLQRPEKGTDLSGALRYAADSHVNLRGIVLLSDGDWNTGESPQTAATDLRMKNVPVFAVGVGSESRLPDVELVSSDAPTFALAGKTLRIPFRIVSWLPDDQDITVTLEGTGGAQIQKTVHVSGMGQVQDTIEWKPKEPAEHTLTLSIPVLEGETITENNLVSLPMSVRNEALRVLVVETYPRWEYRYLRNALERDPGVEVNCLLTHPDLKDVGGGRGYLEAFPDEKSLFSYDVVFLGDVGVDQGQLSLENCEHLRQLVRSHAGGLVFLPGFRGYQNTLHTTELKDLYPVVPDMANPRGFGSERPDRFTLTEAGRRSLLTRLETADDRNEAVWNSLPGFYWHAASVRARIGSEVLAVHSSRTNNYGRVPLIATRTAGTGKVLFMGTDGAWRWRKGVEDLYHYRFWGQVVRWMAYQRNMSQGKGMRLFFSPDRPESGHVLTLNANIMTASGEPLRSGTVTVQAIAPSGATQSVRLAPAGEDSWGLFTGSFTPAEGGSWQLITYCSETGERLETTVAVRGQEKEQIGQPAKFDVLKEIAAVTRGRMTEISQLQQLVDDIAAIPEPQPEIVRFRLWSNPFWGGAIILLLAVFWTGRKYAGLA